MSSHYDFKNSLRDKRFTASHVCSLFNSSFINQRSSLILLSQQNILASSANKINVNLFKKITNIIDVQNKQLRS